MFLTVSLGGMFRLFLFLAGISFLLEKYI